MIQIKDTIISSDILLKEFVCNLEKCKGICCVEGDSGAPLEEKELSVLDDIYDTISPVLRKEGKKAIEEQGKYIIDFEGDYVTPLVNTKECAYLIFDENQIAKCGIEKAYEQGLTDFIKPISCHLYPIRLQKYSTFTALNYDIWAICNDACILGEKLQVKVFEFLKVPLIRRFGKEWYHELSKVYEEYKNKKP